MYTTELSHDLTIVSELKEELSIIFRKYVIKRSLTCFTYILRDNLFKICTKSKK